MIELEAAHLPLILERLRRKPIEVVLDLGGV